ncbi:tropinone reductase homolog [Trifolium pratense]|uniref:tropinone reductase homolog n=1 Tax=Trifolium pratense TaxID=57577 RepID=UPI001E697F2E|nr:tropinone reductase homolog [Trifolium pratense]
MGETKLSGLKDKRWSLQGMTALVTGGTRGIGDEDITSTIGTNFVSGYHLCQLGHPLLKQSGYENVVFISSIAGLKAIPVASVYAATKGAVNQFTKNLALEWAKDNIRANSVAPGPVKTILLESVMVWYIHLVHVKFDPI